MTTPRQATDTDAGRFYQLGGQDYISVTTVLKALPKESLVGWAATRASEFWRKAMEKRSCVNCDTLGLEKLYQAARMEYERQRDVAGALGDAVHGHAEFILRNDLSLAEAREYAADIKDTKVRRRVQSFVRWLEDFRVVPVEIEATIYNDTYMYAGSCDLMADVYRLNGEYLGRLVIDFKTSKSIYGSVALQATAYARGELIVGDDGCVENMHEIDGAAVLHIKANSYVFRELDISDEVFFHFLGLLSIKREWLMDVEHRALGRHISPTGSG